MTTHTVNRYDMFSYEGGHQLLEGQQRDEVLRCLIEEKSLNPAYAIGMLNDAERYGERIGGGYRVIKCDPVPEPSSVVADYMAEFEAKPDVTIDLRETPKANDDPISKHRHVCIIMEDASEMWLDISTDASDHNFTDIRWMNPAGEMKGIGYFTIVNGMRGSQNTELRDTEGVPVRGYKWNGGYVTTLLVEKNGEEKSSRKPSNGNG
jgi:hypothetical protein